MSRTKNTGAAISIRLPLKEDAAFRERAKAEGMTPGAYLRQIALSTLTCFV